MNAIQLSNLVELLKRIIKDRLKKELFEVNIVFRNDPNPFTITGPDTTGPLSLPGVVEFNSVTDEVSIQSWYKTVDDHLVGFGYGPKTRTLAVFYSMINRAKI